jgi:ubiquinone/menaquinone biosynthesis C-methylase UbiE
MNNDQKLWTYHQTNNAKNLILGHPRQEILFKSVLKTISNGKILEIGFGDGYLLERLSSSAYECYGSDISIENIAQMKKKLPSVNFLQASLDSALPYQGNFFDVFIASEVLEHMTNEELALCVSEMQRVLRIGGYAIITFPAEENLKENECFCPSCGEKFHKWGHKQFWDEAKIRKIFSSFDIKVLKRQYVRVPGMNIFGAIDYFLRNFLHRFFGLNPSNMTFFVILKKKI